eukprot:844660-Prymnesium_polylepis.1
MIDAHPEARGLQLQVPWAPLMLSSAAAARSLSGSVAGRVEIASRESACAMRPRRLAPHGDT